MEDVSLGMNFEIQGRIVLGKRAQDIGNLHSGYYTCCMQWNLGEAEEESRGQIMEVFLVFCKALEDFNQQMTWSDFHCSLSV